MRREWVECVFFLGRGFGFVLMVVGVCVSLFFGFVKFVNLLGLRFLFRGGFPRVVDVVVFGSEVDLVVFVVSLIAVLGYSLFLLFGTGRGFSYPGWVVWVCFGSLLSLVLFFVDVNVASFVVVPLGLIVCFVLVFFGFGIKEDRGRACLFVLFGFLVILIVVGLAASFTWLWNLVDYGVPFSSGKWSFALIDVELMNVFYGLVPFLFLAFLFSWIWVPCFDFVFSRVRGFSFGDRVGGFSFLGFRLERVWLVVCLVGLLLLTGFVVYFPVLSSRGSVLVGSDSRHYYDVLLDLADGGGASVVLASDRPLSYLLLFFVRLVTGFSAEGVVRLMPVLLACCLVLVVFFFVRVWTKNDVFSLLSAFFTAFSFQTLIGVHAYFLANCVALVFLFLLLVFLLKSFRSKSILFLVMACLFGFFVFLSHPYTWYVVLGFLGIFLVWEFVKGYRVSGWGVGLEVWFLFVFLVVNVLFFVLYSFLPFGGRVVGSAGGLSNGVIGDFSVLNLVSVGKTVADAVFVRFDGLFVNPLMLVLAILGVVWVYFSRNRFSRVLVFWVVLVSLGLFVVGVDNHYASRLLYLVPFQIFAALGLFGVLVFVDGQDSLGDLEKRVFKFLLVVFVGVSLFNYALFLVDGAPFFFV